jgi:hypothetical protein
MHRACGNSDTDCPHGRSLRPGHELRILFTLLGSRAHHPSRVNEGPGTSQSSRFTGPWSGADAAMNERPFSPMPAHGCVRGMTGLGQSGRALTGSGTRAAGAYAVLAAWPPGRELPNCPRLSNSAVTCSSRSRTDSDKSALGAASPPWSRIWRTRRSSREGTCGQWPRRWRAALTSSSAEGTGAAELRGGIGCREESAMPEPSGLIGAGCLAELIVPVLRQVAPSEASVPLTEAPGRPANRTRLFRGPAPALPYAYDSGPGLERWSSAGRCPLVHQAAAPAESTGRASCGNAAYGESVGVFLSEVPDSVVLWTAIRCPNRPSHNRPSHNRPSRNG